MKKLTRLWRTKKKAVVTALGMAVQIANVLGPKNPDVALATAVLGVLGVHKAENEKV